MVHLYKYCLNNPIKYIGHEGNLIFVPVKNVVKSIVDILIVTTIGIYPLKT